MMMSNGGNSYGWVFDADDADLTADDGAMSMDMDSFLSILNEGPPDDSSQVNRLLWCDLARTQGGQSEIMIAEQNPKKPLKEDSIHHRSYWRLELRGWILDFIGCQRQLVKPLMAPRELVRNKDMCFVALKKWSRAQGDMRCLLSDIFFQIALADPSLSIAPCNESALHIGAIEHSQTHDGNICFSSMNSIKTDYVCSLVFFPLDHSETSASRTVCSSGSSDCERQTDNHVLTKVGPVPDVSSKHFSSWSAGDWTVPVPPGDGTSCLASNVVSQDFSSSSHYDTREANFERASGGGTFGINGDHQRMDKYGITDDNVKNPFIDVTGYSDIPCNPDNESSMRNMNGSEPSYSGLSRHCQSSGPHPVIYNNRLSYNDKIASEQHLMHNASSNSASDETQAESIGGGSLVYQNSGIKTYLPSSESSTDTPVKGSTTTSMLPNRRQMVSIMDAKADVPGATLGSARKSFEFADDVDSEKSYDIANWPFTDKGSLHSFSGILDYESRKNHDAKGEQDTKPSRRVIKIIDDTCMGNGTPADSRRFNLHSLAKSFVHRDTSIKKQQVFTKEERENTFVACGNMGSNSIPPKISHQPVGNSSTSGNVTYIDVDDPDICILEDISEPAPRKQSPVDGKSPISAQRSSLSAPPTHVGFNNAKLKANDERFIYRVALQDLSQPKSEAYAPDGSLVVSLLRHQRIALSWMVQKETKSLHCFGGILADDQGLGKTISTIALILKERSPPSSSVHTTEVKKIETETLNLDDDDDDAVTELVKPKQEVDSCLIETNGSSIKSKGSSVQTKSRPAAGTLVVCPTSVLRQWNDELHNKVSSEAKLSVLVYHGANRTKDPFELAKYDVVLTTYAIVSMEVPKQPLVDEDEDETRRRHDFLPVGISPGKKRKYPPSSSKGSKKDKKGMDSELYESLARPLAKVRWFRVVLDEAQSIKNHRTQVARACWGLRAKRRWCLSGTPIQNAIDDLYSYFRFLKYDPYAVYKSFCSTIKAPIQRSPGTGYKKLQAVLKTIMLRRTKATLLDGEPIISLPPKTINLKKVEFTAEERDFYCRLEADSRAQFAEYAAAGTVKQNYVNILLMLLRLRQACDHPLLVKGCSSNSEWKSSIDKAKKLPPEKRTRLLNCLEASLAICSICSDPPEDAVVTTCEHVFCNQCILEHLSSDDSQCPFSKCKVILNTSSVFSKSTLRVSLGDQYHQGNNALVCSGSLKAEVLEPCSTSGSVNSSNIEAAEALDSSKIKAAIEVLQSIAKPRVVAMDAGGGSPEKCPNDNVNGNVVVREKAIVFSQWTRMLDLLEACLKDSSIGYRRLDGTMSVVARDKAVKDFNTLPEVSVMIMSLKAASLGLNMVAACHVMLLDLWWNPTTEDQAIDRAHRIGQTRPVSVLRLTVKDTVEDRILALQQKKREMVSSAFGEDETGSSQTRLTVDDLKYLFQA
ncbi:hypothetical protein OSB04_008279 [Centaurea solstitialis]|uniref:Helicase-like transcription factor CHR28 n=1 Tax=Centaurea solstitialis TaxID=347529 RepID=A0AA38WT24_9ASTR|nr:hypothetical protein OSB04_008279 [Centaurea solstitialis]